MGAFLRRLLGGLLLLTAIAVPLAQAPDRPVESLVARWAPRPSDFIEVRGQLVHVRDEGPRNDPAPLLLIHGTSASLHTWEGWAEGLRAERRVIRFDLPGFGLTGPFTGAYDPSDYRGDTLARFTLDLMDALKLPRAVLAGNSLGGEVAWRVASLAPQRVDRLVLVDASGLAFEPQDLPLGLRLAATRGARWLSRHLLPRGVVEQSLRSVYGDPSKVSAALVDRYFELTLREGNREALGRRLAQLSMGEDADRLGRLTQPTLILWGERDRLIPPPVSEDFARRIPGSRRVLLPGLGHVPQEEDPVASLVPLRTFLGRAPDAASAAAR